ncbi:G2 and S phase-expressed protein 1 [Echinops telfairi]|uniref:G2 and S phase-expressed protein 1 n=1 Tax=Echinops telfairi TaxID=9371 RepID=A0AC55D4F7_ECHTE|nr:G2 and S phase-expressed protein 1 [Echinops telfairi]
MDGGERGPGPAASLAGKEDLLLLADEKFDFDLSLSSSSANEDDEVFLGIKGSCSAAGVDLYTPAPESCFPWSPFTREKFEEVCKEAHLLALQIEGSSKDTEQPGRLRDAQGPEVFLQDSELKISLFEKGSTMQKSPASLKRETYCLAQSPLRGPPGRAQAPSTAHAPRSTPAPPSLGQTQASQPSAHPLSQLVVPKRNRSRLQPPRVPAVRGKSVPPPLEKPKKERPASLSTMKPPSVEPHREGLPERPTSGTHLALGKRALPVPNKLGPKRSLARPPGRTGSLPRRSAPSGPAVGATSRRVAPQARGAGQSGVRRTLSRPGASAPQQCRPPGPADAAGPQALPACVAEVPVEQPMADTAALSHPRTPESAGAGLDATFLLPESGQLDSAARTQRRRDSCLNPRTRALPTPTSQFKIPKFSIGVSPVSATPQRAQAPRPQACKSVGSSVPIVSKRGQGIRELPAPPKGSDPRGCSLCSEVGCTPSHLTELPGHRLPPLPPRKQLSARPSDSLSDGSPSPPSAMPQVLRFSPEKGDSTFQKVLTPEAAVTENSPLSEAVVDIQLAQLTITPEAKSPPLADLPLIDFNNSSEAGGHQPPSRPSADGRPLIDLMINTPDTSRDVTPKPLPGVGQLIDLASPLIQLSPAADKENVESPLLRF